ncbi:hypothetical protein [Pseudomonas donghuensis]|uniref:hypothetical protein n=1 Tax=Pseudomonas donghuensis TaxID=1163398 RepID=UPI000299FCB8|nr:hypothetical protein [Pseudomonas donghuensis]
MKIKTPRPDQYIELSGKDLVEGKGEEFNATAFDQLDIVVGKTHIRWRLDPRTPTGAGDAPGFGRVSTARGSFPPKSETIPKNGHLKLEFHVSSPLSPRERGIWVRLWLKVVDGNLQFVHMPTESGGTYIADASDLEKGLSKWFSDERYRWVVDQQRQPSRGNALLCATVAGQPGRENLVHIDASLKAQNPNHYSLAFVLVRAFDQDIYNVCTELLLDSSFISAAPVSGYALRLDFAERARAPLVANGLRLLCIPGTKHQGWWLEWSKIPGGRGQRPAETLTLESITQGLLEGHALGLATTRSRNRLSLVPTWISSDSADDPVTLVFRLLADAQQKLTDTRLESIQLTQRTNIALHCGGALDIDGQPLVLRGWAEQAPSKLDPLLSWTLRNDDVTQPPYRLGIGSVLLSMASFKGGSLTLSIADEGAAYRRAPLESVLELEFDKANYTALSMDPELGFETLSDAVERKRPWAFDLEPAESCKLTIEECANQQQSRLLRMALQLDAVKEHKIDVILVDPGPLTVARVQSLERPKGDEILVEYLDDADQAPEWRFYSTRGEMTVILPPQGIGEEMIKGYLHLDRDDPANPNNKSRTRVPGENELFDFRLTPPAVLRLDRTDVDMARSEAPWSLRRLLARRLGAVGVKLESADFELLYGLAAHLETEGLRIAELDGFIGRVPFPDELQVVPRGGDASVKQLYAERVRHWLSGLWARPSWWRVYRDIAQRGRVLVDQGLSYRLRATRDTAHPFDIGHRHDYTTTAREPLRGGVDWPFQSRNIYEELRAKPFSSAASIEGLVFGTLGGEGTQTAAFNNGKTLIITNTRQGRLDSFTLIRVGRISMLWNKARHVIVYERTTRCAPRYTGECPPGQQDTLEAQPEFAGIAALRKVREYVEITEPRRLYPDHKTTLPSGGPLVQSVFGSIQIPVRSDWGQDIPDGFIISLRGPIPAGRELEFPDPHAFLDLARAPGKGEGAIAHRINSTERLVFFSSTRDQDGGDTDAWPAWPDVDFPLLKRPRSPDLPFNSSFQGRIRQPDAAAIELGMARFTFTLDPAEEAVDLMHGRNVPGLEAKVTNINLARGLPKDERKQTLEVETIAEPFGNVQAQLVDGLAELRAVLRERVAAGENPSLDKEPQLKEDVSKLLQRLRAAVSDVPQPTSGNTRGWLEQQSDRNRQYINAIKGVDSNVGDAVRLGQQMEVLANRVLGNAVAQDLEPARNQASAIVDTISQQARQRVGEVGFVPQQALAAVRRLLESLKDGFETRLSRLVGDLMLEIQRIEKAYEVDPDNAADLDARWRMTFAGLPVQLRHLVEVLDQLADGALGEWFSRVSSNPTVYKRLGESIASQLDAAIDWLDRWNDSLPPFDVVPPDFEAMQSTLSSSIGKSFAASLVSSASEPFKKMWEQMAGVTEITKAAVADIDAWAKGLEKKIQGALSVDDLRDALLAGANGLIGELGRVAEKVSTDLLAEFNQLSFGDLQGSMDVLKDFKCETSDALQTIENQLSGTLGDLERAVREQAETVQDYVQAGGRQLEDWARTSLGPEVEIARQNLDAGLETLRMLAQGPVTEALQTSRELVGYYFEQANQTLGLTRASAYFNHLGQDMLNSLSASMPFDRIRDRLLPKIGGLAIRDLFPDFCGIKLTYFLPDLDVPLDGSYEFEWIKLQHGFDKDRLRAWAKVSINKQFDEPATLFDLGPVKLRLINPHFIADSDLSVAKDGTRWQRTAAALNADFQLSLNDKPMVTLREASLNFNEQGELKFDFDGEKLELAPELQFITDALKAMMPQMEGATITPLLPSGVSASLSLPLPDIGTGAFTLTGITLNTHLDLLIGDGFEISTGLWLSKPDRPFALAVLFLGGGGWFGIDASYKPPSRFVTRVSVGVSAGAFVAVNFGFAQGSAGILFTGGVDFYRDWQSGTGSSALSVGILVWGEFSVMGIASASVRLTLRITYDGGGMTGKGTFNVSIRICWCYTLRVSRQAQKVFSGSGTNNDSGTRGNSNRALSRRLSDVTSAGPGATGLVDAPDYGVLAATDMAGAVNDYFETLAVYRSEP